MSVVGCLMAWRRTQRASGPDREETAMMHDGWCPDCDLRTVVIDSDESGSGNAWASCTECGVGWVHREEHPSESSPRVAERQPAERRAA
jgi:transcription elongation factor Elf1